MNSPRECQGINLMSQSTINSRTVIMLRSNYSDPTVLRLKTPITLSHSVPWLGIHPSSFDKPLARFATLSRTCRAEYSMPLSPQVNGGLA